jgi:transposase
MTISARHLGIEELEARSRAATDVVERSRCQADLALAKGHTTAEVAELVALTPRWVNRLARRYEREGAEALGDQRRRNAGCKPLLSTQDLEALRERLRTPPDDGAGRGRGPRVARWIAAPDGARACSCPARLGRAKEAQLVDPVAASAEAEGSRTARDRGI